MLEHHQVNRQGTQVRADAHRRVRHALRARGHMHLPAAAPGLMQIMLNAAGRDQRHLQLLERPGHPRDPPRRPGPPRTRTHPRGGDRSPHRARAHAIDVPAAPGCFPRPRPLPRASRLGGTFPGRSSVLGGIEELPLLRPSRCLDRDLGPQLLNRPHQLTDQLIPRRARRAPRGRRRQAGHRPP